MRDSGVEWLGTVPEHWQVVRGNAVLVEQRTRNNPLVSENYLSLMANVGIIPYEEKGDVGNKKSDDLRKCKLVSRGDFVINSMNYAIGSYGVSRYDGVCSSVYVVMRHRPDLADPGYIDLILSSSSYQNYAQSLGTGILDHRRAIGWDEIKAIRVPLPTLKEQAEIVAWTTWRRSRIDGLIAKKTLFIDLLREKRQALITHAVTKGLDSGVPMEDSGIEWFGTIPSDWKSPRIKHVALLGNGSTPARENTAYWKDGHFPWLTSSCVNKNSVCAAEEFVTAVALKECHLPIIEPPAVLVGITGQGRTRGMATTLRIHATINQHIIYLKPKFNSISADYLRYFVDSAYDRLRSESEGAGSTKGAITIEQLSNIRIPLPVIEEQREIVAYLNGATARIDKLIQKTERSIELLREHRTAIITAAVTGKIDLSNAA